MRTSKFLIKESLNKLQSIYKNSPESFLPRINILLLIKKDPHIQTKEIARKLNVSRVNVYYWIKLYKKHGIKRLISPQSYYKHNAPHQGSAIKNEVKEEIARQIKKTPFQGYTKLQALLKIKFPRHRISYTTLFSHIRRYYGDLQSPKKTSTFIITESFRELQLIYNNVNPTYKNRVKMLILLKNPEAFKIKDMLIELNVRDVTLYYWIKLYKKYGIKRLISPKSFRKQLSDNSLVIKKSMKQEIAKQVKNGNFQSYSRLLDLLRIKFPKSEINYATLYMYIKRNLITPRDNRGK